jgi:hypothetical protein
VYEKIIRETLIQYCSRKRKSNLLHILLGIVLVTSYRGVKKIMGGTQEERWVEE